VQHVQASGQLDAFQQDIIKASRAPTQDLERVKRLLAALLEFRAESHNGYTKEGLLRVAMQVVQEGRGQACVL
jgi:hypothetical protein